jgi:hypothetical protein
MAAVIKCNVRRHMNEKNNVENGRQFVEAAKATKHLSSYASKIIPHVQANKASSSIKKVDWSGITMFNNIEYTLKSSTSENKHGNLRKSSVKYNEIEVTTWRSYGIGNGKTFLWSNLNTVKDADQLIVLYEPPQSTDSWMIENSKSTFH